MALTTLDPKPALIVIDLQKGIVDAPTVHPTSEIVEGCQPGQHVPPPCSARRAGQRNRWSTRAY